MQATTCKNILFPHSIEVSGHMAQHWLLFTACCMTPAGGSVAIEMLSVVWDCLWFWYLKDPLGTIKKSRALCLSPGFLPRPNITVNVCSFVSFAQGFVIHDLPMKVI